MALAMAKNQAKWIKWALAVILPLIVWLIPTGELFTPDLRMFFVVTLFIIVLMALELVPVVVCSVLLGTLYLISGIVPAETAFASWTNTTVWMVFGGLIFSTMLEQCGLLSRIAYYIITKCGGTFNGAVIGVFIVGIVLNIITFCNGWIVACVLVYGVCRAMNLEKSKQAGLICFAGAIGSNGSVIYLYHPGFVNLQQGALQQFISPDYTMSFLTPFKYIGWAVPCCLITIFIFMKVYNTKEMNDRFNKQVFEEKLKELGALSKKEKIAIVFIIILLGYLISCQFTGLPAAYGFMIIPYLMFLPGIELGNGETIKKTNLGNIFFISACLGIGTVGAAVGFGDFLTAVSVPILSGKSTLVMCLFFMLVGVLANLVMTPFAMLGCLAIPFAQVSSALGMNPIAACMILQYTIDMVFLPHEASGNLIMYSYGVWSMKDFVIQNTVKTLINTLVFLVIMYPLWNLFGMV